MRTPSFSVARRLVAQKARNDVLKLKMALPIPRVPRVLDAPPLFVMAVCLPKEE